MLWLEPSGICNLDCPGCPTAEGRGGGVMSLANFTRLIDQVPKLKLLNLWHRGEPLVAPDFPLMVNLATQRGIKTQTHTNGLLLSRKHLAEQLVEAGLSQISIGVDGADEPTYRQYRTGGRLATVEQGLAALVGARKKMGSKTPRIIIECLLSRQSVNQFRAVQQLADQWGCDELKFKTYRVTNPEHLAESLQTLPANPKLWRYKQVNNALQPRQRHQHCIRLWHSAVIAWNGDVLPCCFDAKGEYLLGNVLDTPWLEIWQGAKIREFQKKVRQSKRQAFPMCQNCTEGLRHLYLPARRVLK